MTSNPTSEFVNHCCPGKLFLGYDPREDISWFDQVFNSYDPGNFCCVSSFPLFVLSFVRPKEKGGNGRAASFTMKRMLHGSRHARKPKSSMLTEKASRGAWPSPAPAAHIPFGLPCRPAPRSACPPGIQARFYRARSVPPPLHHQPHISFFHLRCSRLAMR